MTRHKRSRLFAAGIGLLAVCLLVVPSAGASGSKGGSTTPAAPAGSATPRLSTTASARLTDQVTAAKSPSSALAQTDPALLGRTDATPVRVMIKFDYDSTASYSGGVDGLEPTSPAVTGQPLTGSSAPERAYEAHVAEEEGSIVAEIRRRVPEATFGRSLRRVYGGVSAVLPAHRVGDVLGVPGVVAVQENALRQPLTDSSAEFINAPPVYQALGGTANAGEGVIYGNLDTGIWPEHPSFADLGNLSAPPGPARECNYGDNPLTQPADVFVCQNKLIGGAHFTDDYDVIEGDDPYQGTARDGDGHGTHTSSTSAGNIVEDVSALGRALPDIAGIAPGAWVIEYKVCGPGGCYGSDSAAAVGQAIVDGVDVINFSISGGTNPFTDPVELAFLDAYAAGVFVAASAGNDGPEPGTVNHLSPWVTSVAASTQTREFATTLQVSASGGDTFTADGATITAGVPSPTPIVLASAAPYSDANCSTPAAPGTFTGMVVACQRGGGIARVFKGYAVAQGGAVGMILYNATLQDTETDNHWLPTVHLADGTSFLAFMASHTGETATWAQGEARDGEGDVMAAFSSRGPGGLFIKPDVTAPGVQILAGASPTPPAPDPIDGGSPPGNLFQAIAGTSMSSPHVAGAAILSRAVHPAWTPGQIKSSLMTSSVTDVVKEDLVTPADPFDLGAGRIDVGRSAVVPFTFDETADNFFAMADDPVQAPHLNIPSVNASVMPGRLVTTRTLVSTGASAKTVTASAQAPPGTSITVSPRQFALNPNASVTLTITITATSPAVVGQQQFGQIRLRPVGQPVQHLPVAFIPTQGSVSLTQSCSPTAIQISSQSTCTINAANNTFTSQTVNFETSTSSNLRVMSATGGATVVNPRLARRTGVVLSAAQPGVPSVDPGALFGYIPLQDFGIDPIAIGDEQILNFDISGATIPFNGQQWSRIGVDSNGYVVLGGGTSEDNECCTIPAGPSPARPNNMVAPLWTDLDGTAAPGVRVAFIGTATDEWLVVEYQVNVFGTSDLRTFQIWFGDSSAFDDDDLQDITMAYAAPQTDPSGQDFLYGAENIAGAGEMLASLPTQDQRVTSTPFTPGGTATYTVNVRGESQGIGNVRTEMTATGVPGVTVVNSSITIFKKGQGPT